MKLNKKQLGSIRDFAIDFAIDNPDTLCYPISNNWIYGLVETLKGEGYAIVIKPINTLINNAISPFTKVESLSASK